jgi:hypothetical protein
LPPFSNIAQPFSMNPFRFILIFIIFLLFKLNSAFSQTRDLNYYLLQAAQNSPLLKNYSNQLQAVHFDSLLILANKKLQIAGNAEAMEAPYGNHFGYDTNITNKGLFEALLSEKLILFQKNKLAAQIHSSDLHAQELNNSYFIDARVLQKTITDQYLVTYSDLSAIENEKEIIGSLTNEDSILLQLMQNAIFAQSDYLNFRLQVKSEQRQLQIFSATYYNDLIQLNILSGIDDTSEVVISKPDLTWKTNYSLQANPNWFQFHLDSLQNENAKSLLAFNYKPQIALFADEGLNAVEIPGLYNHFGFSAGISLSWTIADGGQRSLNLQKLNIKQNSISVYKSFYQKQNALQIFGFEKQREQNQVLISNLNDNLKSMDQLLSMRKQQLENGQLSIIDYLSNLRDKISLQKQLSDALLQREQIISDHNQFVW